MNTVIPLEVKKACCQLKTEGKTIREVYETYFTQVTDSPASYNSFRSMICRWMKKQWADDTTLAAGTYEGFIAHDATVQVSKSGEIIQAWIKQKTGDFDPHDFLKAIRAAVEPFEYIPKDRFDTDRMLEIPLFDMHWGVAYMDYYKPVLTEILDLVTSRKWDKIVIPFGQDFFHNDSVVKGETTKGTQIEKVDTIRAVKDGKVFMYALIDAAVQSANEVSVIYTPGNHDTSMSWMFMQALLERYGASMVDDALEYRKVVSYGKIVFMVTHGESKRMIAAKELAHSFPVAFPNEFANSLVREIHAGHLHNEAEADIYGVMVRRLSTGSKTDRWSDKEGYIGAHKRFMLFEWAKHKLASIHYI